MLLVGIGLNDSPRHHGSLINHCVYLRMRSRHNIIVSTAPLLGQKSPFVLQTDLKVSELLYNVNVHVNSTDESRIFKSWFFFCPKINGMFFPCGIRSQLDWKFVAN